MTSGFDFHSFFFGQTHVEPTILSSLFEGIRYITSHSAGGWEICCAGLQRYWARPSALGLYLIGALLDEGLNPNLRIATLRRPTQDRLHPLLVYAFEGVNHYKAKNDTIGQVDGLTASEPGLPEEEEFPRPWCILVCLIRSGADIHYIFEDSFDHASSWYDLESLGVFSVAWDSATEWDRAVLEAGFDLDQYLSDDRQSRKHSFRLRGATRSGIDERVLDLPSTAGLKCRRCRRNIALSMAAIFSKITCSSSFIACGKANISHWRYGPPCRFRYSVTSRGKHNDSLRRLLPY
ncbi:hypothetical protein IQ07DRAFT_93694 [Pyrenochaeta sp. DS3sAY3a]|nr:hypothetical protein IQ07DRAFT_93694 [Pyrenochaeta sp. DS3sAY3a]